MGAGGSSSCAVTQQSVPTSGDMQRVNSSDPRRLSDSSEEPDGDPDSIRPLLGTRSSSTSSFDSSVAGRPSRHGCPPPPLPSGRSLERQHAMDDHDHVAEFGVAMGEASASADTQQVQSRLHLFMKSEEVRVQTYAPFDFEASLEFQVIETEGRVSGIKRG